MARDQLRTAAERVVYEHDKGNWGWPLQEAIAALGAALAEPVLEQHFCPRCGKRTRDIHTCTPPEVHP